MAIASDKHLIGESPAFLETVERVSAAAPLNKPVLLIGERGTGKELMAERLHYLSPRWQRQLVKLNCAALPESLLESEMFGYEAGAFTGANKRHRGRFERADGGTLFLDEIASMSLRLQEKLLRVIEYGQFERLGGDATLQVDVRVVGAANLDLPQLAREGRFRADLLDRLSFDVITLPPLRYRREDIDLLAEHFALGMVKELRRQYFPGFTETAVARLREYDWPGNLRELKNVVERAVYRCGEDEFVDEVEFDPFRSPYRPLADANEQQAESEPVAPAAAPAAAVMLPMDFKRHISELEQSILAEALDASRHNQRRAAELLGLSYHQLRGYLRKYRLLPAMQRRASGGGDEAR
jgi:psp operon transcriptional activator